jgi:Mg-chelatase subunit ChlD
MPRLATTLLALALAAPPAAADDLRPENAAIPVPDVANDLELTLAAPEPHALIGGEDGRVFVTGRALSQAGEHETFDVVIVIDTSYSTAAPSGADIDGDGNMGRHVLARIPILGWLFPFGNSDRDDSVLAAEIAAGRTLLDQLDPRTTRVGVVAFSGDSRESTADARTIVPLTSRYRSVRNGLSVLLKEGPHGRTNMYDAVHVATSELGGFGNAISEPRHDPEEGTRVMLFMTDGRPTLPVAREPMENARLAIGAARFAGGFDIRIDTFAIGRASRDPVAPVEMSAVTEGIYTPVEDPRDLVAIFENVSLARLRGVHVRNDTTGEDADHVFVGADGFFSALVQLQDGVNWLEVTAVDHDGVEGTRRIPVKRMPLASPQRLSPRLEARRIRMLENQLAELRKRGLEIQLARDEQLRRDLEVEIATARRKRELEQRRALEVSVDPTVPASPAD